MIEINYKTNEAYSFLAFNMKELKTEVQTALKGQPRTVSDIIIESEKTIKQKDIAQKLGVTPRYLRYIKTGKRLRTGGTKKDKTLRKKIFSFGRLIGLTFGGYSSGQMRACNYLDFVCEKEGEIVKDIHEIYYEHGSISVTHVNDKGLYDVLQNNIRDSITMMCLEGSYCEDVLLYNRGNAHPKKEKFCDFCGSELITQNNKRLIYSVVMKK